MKTALKTGEKPGKTGRIQMHVKKSFLPVILAAGLFYAIVGCRASKPEVVQRPAPEPIHNEWIEADRETITRVNDVLKNDPADIEKVLPDQSSGEGSLGFGYRFGGGFTKGGYASYNYTFLYHNGKLVCYEVAPPIPRYQRSLKPVYQEMNQDVFPTGTNGTLRTYWYHLEASEAPLEGCPTKPVISEKMAFFMSPYSGTVYGIRGGIIGSVLPNRQCYMEVEKEITPEICVMLLYSINPASRLTAYEHFLRHRKKKEYRAISESVEKRMSQVFAETPKITTMSGCIITESDSASLVQEFAGLSERERR